MSFPSELIGEVAGHSGVHGVVALASLGSQPRRDVSPFLFHDLHVRGSHYNFAYYKDLANVPAISTFARRLTIHAAVIDEDCVEFLNSLKFLHTLYLVQSELKVEWSTFDGLPLFQGHSIRVIGIDIGVHFLSFPWVFISCPNMTVLDVFETHPRHGDPPYAALGDLRTAKAFEKLIFRGHPWCASTVSKALHALFSYDTIRHLEFDEWTGICSDSFRHMPGLTHLSILNGGQYSLGRLTQVQHLDLVGYMFELSAYCIVLLSAPPSLSTLEIRVLEEPLTIVAELPGVWKSLDSLIATHFKSLRVCRIGLGGVPGNPDCTPSDYCHCKAIIKGRMRQTNESKKLVLVLFDQNVEGIDKLPVLLLQIYKATFVYLSCSVDNLVNYQRFYFTQFLCYSLYEIFSSLKAVDFPDPIEAGSSGGGSS
ncbi:hypothetical protein C8J56DRAFT_1173959 [Mycena floridula]|nr:hypothetical protein C8J56DRAFT_1173959 [Mycena floridula]